MLTTVQWKATYDHHSGMSADRQTGMTLQQQLRDYNLFAGKRQRRLAPPQKNIKASVSDTPSQTSTQVPMFSKVQTTVDQVFKHRAQGGNSHLNNQSLLPFPVSNPYHTPLCHSQIMSPHTCMEILCIYIYAEMITQEGESYGAKNLYKELQVTK